MLGDNDSSSESDNQDFQCKKVKCPENMDNEEEDSQSEQSIEQQEKASKGQQNCNMRNKSQIKKEEEEGVQHQKTKIIKKNCVSAKMSRQRKKQYIDLLEQKAQGYIRQITKTKENIQKQQQSIMSMVKISNNEKYTYLNQKLVQSKQIAQIILSSQSNSIPIAKHIDSFLVQNAQQQYKFGSTGVLRKDVVEVQKQRWYQLAIDSRVINDEKERQQAEKNFKQFDNCIRELDDKSKRMQFLIRKLQANFKQELVGKFLVDKVFLIKTTKPHSD